MKKLYTIIALMFVITISKAQWTAVNTGLTDLNTRTIAISGTYIFSGTEGGGVFLSTNNGSNWSAVNSGLTNLNITTIATSGSNIFVGTYGGGVFLSTNNGGLWTAVNIGLTSLNILTITISGTNIFAGTNAGIYLSTNNGNSWTPMNSGLPSAPLPSISEFATSGTNIFAGDGSMSGTCGVYLSTDNGSSWSAVNTGIFYVCVQALAINGTSIFTGNMGSVYSSTNNGTTWSATNSGLPGGSYVTSFAISGINIFAATSDGSVYLTTNNGNSWFDVSTGLPGSQYVASLAVTGTDIFAGIGGMGGEGVFIRSLSDIFTGIEETKDEYSFTIAPNPFTSQTTITFDKEQKNTIIKITDGLGKVIKTITFVGKKCVIEKGEMQKGIFFIEIINETKKTSKRKIVID